MGLCASRSFEGLRLPTVPKPKTYAYTVEDALIIIDKAQGKWKLFFRIMGETGVRPGELAGLPRKGGLTGRIVKITQSLWNRNIQTPKSENSIRSFTTSQALANDLKAFIDATPENKYGLVFVTDGHRIRKNQHGSKVVKWDGGKPLDMDNFRQRVLEPILVELGIREKLKRMGIKRCGNYAFRHMNATVMDGMQAPLATRQKRLGHKPGSRITLKNYTHPIDAEDRRVADAFGALLSQEGKEAVQ